MTTSPSRPAVAALPRSRAALAILAMLVAAHLALLALSLRDFRVTIDSGYHVAMGRWYAEHGTAYWDHVNFGPGGRPNLQGPAHHVGIAVIGRLLGGGGDDYVLANAVLSLAQWAAAVWTAVYFARRAAGDLAALVAGAVLVGHVNGSIAFAVGFPSGWIFVATPWAIHWFLQGRWLLAAVAAAGGIYAHLGGYATVPLGLIVAAALTSRWRLLVRTGAAVALLTAPYTMHVLRHLDWYHGERGPVVLLVAPLLYVLAVPGLVRVWRHPRAHPFLAAWSVAPLLWLGQDHARFFSQSTLAMSAIGAAWAAGWLARARPAVGAAAAALLVLLATLPADREQRALRAEARWAGGQHYPRLIDWEDARTLAGAITGARLEARLVAGYDPSQCVRIAAFAPVRFEKGHWIEVQPSDDPADRLSAAEKVYVLAVPPDDPLLAEAVRHGWTVVHGGSSRSTVATLTARPAASAVMPWAARVLAAEGRWLSEHAIPNTIVPRGTPLDAWRARMLEQRTRAGRMALAATLAGYAQEQADPDLARTLRGAGRGFGSLASFLGDETAIDFVSPARHAAMQADLARVVEHAEAVAAGRSARPLIDAFGRLFSGYF